MQNNPVIIRGEVAGTGKSYICQRVVDRDFKVTFVCPTKKLLQSFEGEAITINTLFGISFGTVKLDEFDLSEFDVIVFDDVYFANNKNVHWKMKKFVEKNKKDKIIIGTGDALQLKPIQELTNQTDADEIIDEMFENKINLKICKRLKNDDRTKIYKIKYDIFVKQCSFTKVNEKYFSYTTDISGSKYNIAVPNNTSKNISKEIRKKEHGQYMKKEKANLQRIHQS